MQRLSILVLLIFVTGCSNKLDVNEICLQFPQFCNDLHTDGWCRYERTQLVFARYKFYEMAQNDYHKYNLLKSLANYGKCVDLTTHIEYKRDSANSRKNDRVRGVAAARTEYLKIAEQAKNDKGPFMLMWRWLNQSDKSAQRQFIAMEGQDTLKHTDLQAALAGHYARSNPQKAIYILHYALSLMTEEEEIDPQIPASLSTLYMDTEDYDQALIWGYVTQNLSKDAGLLKPEQIAIYAKIPKNRMEALEDQAEDIVEMLQDREYKIPKVAKTGK